MFEAENDIKKYFRYVSFNSERNKEEEAMYDAVIKGNDNHLIELVEEGVNKI